MTRIKKKKQTRGLSFRIVCAPVPRGLLTHRGKFGLVRRSFVVNASAWVLLLTDLALRLNNGADYASSLVEFLSGVDSDL